MFSCTFSGRNSPLHLSILGEKRHAADRSPRPANRSGPARRRCDLAGRRHASRRRASPPLRVRLDPTSPATPRISPARTSNDTSENTPSSDETLDRDHDAIGRHVVFREQLRQLPSDHHRDEPIAIEPARGQRTDDAPVAHDGHLVGDPEDLVDLVRDVDDGLPAGPQVGDDR